MAYPRCPERDILSNRLIEAYRELNFSDATATESRATALNASIVALQTAIQEHRDKCILCQKIASAPRIPAKAGKVA